MQLGSDRPTAIVDSDSDKCAQLTSLAKLRYRPTAGTCRDGFSQDYRRIEELSPWLGDCAWVSPLAITANNVDSDLMIIGQDWAGERYLTRRGDPDRLRLGYDAKLKTNTTLASLLEEAFNREFNQVFATNAFVFIKPGGMSGSIPAGDLRHSAQAYTLREIAIVRPKMAICLGADTYNALRKAAGDALSAVEGCKPRCTGIGDCRRGDLWRSPHRCTRPKLHWWIRSLVGDLEAPSEEAGTLASLKPLNHLRLR